MAFRLPWRFLFFSGVLFSLFLLAFFAFLKLTILSIPFLLALGISTLLEPLLLFWESWGRDRRIGIFLLFLGMCVFFLLFILLLPGVIEDKISLLREHAPGFLKETEKNFSLFLGSLEGKVPGLSAQALLVKLKELSRSLGEGILLSLPSFFSHLLSILLLTPVFTYFILRDRRALRRTLLRLVPNRYFEIVFQLIHRVEEATERYIRGVLLEAVLVGAVAFGVLFAFQVPSSALLGVAVVFFNLIPYFGTLTVSIGGTLYLLLLGAPFEVALLVVVAVGVAHLLDNTLIAPLVLGSAVRIHPLVVILLLVIGGKYLGVLGLVVSVPLGAIVYILLQESWSILERYRLGSG